jgi:hypothetical protein
MPTARRKHADCRRPNTCNTSPPWPSWRADADKALVMALLGILLREDHADWELLDDGDIELRLTTGEAFRLGDSTVTRIARVGTEKKQATRKSRSASERQKPSATLRGPEERTRSRWLSAATLS